MINHNCKFVLLTVTLLFLPLYVFSQSCAQTDNSSVGETTVNTDLDNSTHNNCVSGDVAAWTIDKVYLYTDVYCTEGEQIIDISAVNVPTETNKIDFADKPDLGSASIPDGTYKCVATRMWDNITSSPATATTSGSCVAADNYTQDICGSGYQYYDADNSSLVSCNDNTGNTSDGVGDGNEYIWIYFSTASTDASSDGDDSDFKPPTSDNLTRGVALSGNLVVSGAKSSTLTTDLTDRVADYKCINGGGDCSNGNSECGMQKPAFSFN